MLDSHVSPTRIHVPCYIKPAGPGYSGIMLLKSHVWTDIAFPALLACHSLHSNTPKQGGGQQPAMDTNSPYRYLLHDKFQNGLSADVLFKSKNGQYNTQTFGQTFQSQCDASGALGHAVRWQGLWRFSTQNLFNVAHTVTEYRV